jgi:hypothetical protein
LNPATGERLWTGHYKGTTAGFNSGFALAVSPKGNRVFVTGLQSGQQNGLDSDIITLGYDAINGTQLWNSSYSVPGFAYEWAHDIAVSQDGRWVHVGGLSAQLGATGEYATLTYDAASGSEIAVDRYNSLAGLDTCYGWSLTKDPNDLHLFLTGVCYHSASQGGTTGDASSISTVSYQIAPTPVSVVSRKTHGNVGDFDIDLPLAGDHGIECRRGAVPGQHQIVINFATPVTVASATVTAGRGTVDSYTVSGSTVTVNLKDISDAQTIVLTLTDVNDNTIRGSVSVPMDVLLGDVSGNRIVSNTDVAQIKAQVAAAITRNNFRNDLNANGIVSNTDVSIAKQNVGTILP